MIALVMVALAGGVVLLVKGLGPRPPGAEMLYDQARLAMHRGNLELAEKRLSECLDIEPEHVMARLYYGQMLRDRGETERALELWRSIRDASDSQIATARYLQGGVAIERGRVDQSRDLFEEAVRLNPTAIEPREKLILVYRMLRRSESLVRLLDEIEQLRPLGVEELILRTVPDDAGYPPDETVHVLRQTLAANPHDEESQAALAAALREQGDLEALETFIESVASNGELNDELRAAHIEALLDAGRTTRAAELCADLDLASVGSLGLLQACGRCALESKDLGQAATLLERVHRQRPYDRDACYRLGQTLERLGYQDVARELIERSVSLDDVQRLCLRLTRGDIVESGQRTAIYLEIAGLLEDLERLNEAADWLAQAAPLAPGDPEIRARLDRLAARAATRPGPIEVPPWKDSVEWAGPRITDSVPGTNASADRPVRGPIRFVDVHDELGIDWTYFNGNTEFQYLIESMGGGVIVLDYDADGWPDLYFPQGCGLPHDPSSSTHRDRLYRNVAGRAFRDVTQAAGLGSNRYGLGGVAADFDNDGFEDLFVTNYGGNQFYRNNGDGTLSEVDLGVLTDRQEMSTSAVAVDVNNDGFLDLYVANYVQDMKPCLGSDGSYAPCDPEVFDGQPDRLLLNDGRGMFRDISSSAGVDLPNGKGLGVVAADFDDDGRVDIYVANDGVPNFLLHNESVDDIVRFSDRGLVSGAALDHEGRSQAGMGIAVADFDGNARSDLYVTNFYLEHNTLYLNEGELLFVDASRNAGLYRPTLPLLGFGTVGRDLNGDGWPDLAVANGHIQRDLTGEQPWKMPAQIFENRGDGGFTDVSTMAGEYFEEQNLGRGLAAVDWNRDGRLDMVVVHQDRPAALLENHTPMTDVPVQIRLVGTRSNRDAVGAVVRIDSGQRTTTYTCGGDGGFLTGHERHRLFRVRPQADVTLEVRWPSGKVSHESLAAGDVSEVTGSMRIWRVVEANETPVGGLD